VAAYIEVEEAKRLPGLRLVLTAGVPGPWGEAAKGLFDVKGVPYARVRQVGGDPNEALHEWTGSDNAPIAVYESEAPRSGWADILHLAERLAPKPSLVPAAPHERVMMFGLLHEIAGENGFAWLRRLMLLHPLLANLPDEPPAGLAPIIRMGGKYGYSSTAAEAAPARIVEILGFLATTLERQREAGRSYLVGDSLSAADIYWATFAAMLEPLPEEQCAMGFMRKQYTLTPASGISFDRALLDHRDFIYREHLTLPLDF